MIKVKVIFTRLISYMVKGFSQASFNLIYSIKVFILFYLLLLLFSYGKNVIFSSLFH